VLPYGLKFRLRLFLDLSKDRVQLVLAWLCVYPNVWAAARKAGFVCRIVTIYGKLNKILISQVSSLWQYQRRLSSKMAQNMALQVTAGVFAVSEGFAKLKY
jgi:hypothetical protein